MLRLNNEEINKCFSRAFTLVELMIVMVVISIMVGFTIPIAKYVTLRARQANQKIYIEKIKSALEDYRAAYGEYPITGKTNLLSQIENPDDVVRHYPANYATYCAAITQGVYSKSGFGNSQYTNANLATNTVENIEAHKIDYCLTYPLMLRQRTEGARPFMEFKNETVVYLVYQPRQDQDVDKGQIKRWFRTRLGDIVQATPADFLRGNPINRPKAVDPVSMKQWKYTSEDGVTYSLTTNGF